MFGLFGMFGRSRELRQLDDALRAAGLQPGLVPEPIKLTMMMMLKEVGPITPSARIGAAQLLSYCILGGDDFGDHNGRDEVAVLEARLNAALDAGDDLDARLILLALHAGVIDQSVVAQFGLEVD